MAWREVSLNHLNSPSHAIFRPDAFPHLGSALAHRRVGRRGSYGLGQVPGCELPVRDWFGANAQAIDLSAPERLIGDKRNDAS